MQIKTSLSLALAMTFAGAVAIHAEEKAAAPAAAKPAAATDSSKAAEAKAAPVAKNDAPGSVAAGNKLADEGKFEDAVAYYEGIGEQVEANGHSKREPWRLVGLSTALIGLGKYDVAAENAQKALDINPNLAPAWNNLASAQGNLGQRDKAIETLTKGIETLKAAKADSSKLESNLAALKDAAEASKPKKVKEAEAKAKAEADKAAAASAPAASTEKK